MDAIEKAGGFPVPGSKAAGAYSGELRYLLEAIKGGRHVGVKGVFTGKLFRKNSRGVDDLATSLRDYGFQVETPADVFNLLDDRLRRGKPIYGQPETANASYGVQEDPASYPIASQAAIDPSLGGGKEVVTSKLRPGDVVDWNGTQRTVAHVAGSVTETKVSPSGVSYPYTRIAGEGERPTVRLDAEHYVVFDDGSHVKVSGTQRVRRYGNATEIRRPQEQASPGGARSTIFPFVSPEMGRTLLI